MESDFDDIFLLDIDGCIIKAVFPNFMEAKGISKELIIKNVLAKSKNIILYPFFYKFYEKWIKRSRAVYFITGRKESEFGDLTKNQLQPINKIKESQILFYPEENSYSTYNNQELYFSWKIRTLISIISKYKKENNIFWVFDDLSDHFEILKKILKDNDIKCRFFHIKDKQNWFYYLNEFKNIKNRYIKEVNKGNESNSKKG
jgi:hypothetical protein